MLKERIGRVCVLGAIALSGVAPIAQQPAAPPPGVTRTILNQQDLAIPGYASALMRVELAAGAREGRHRHPGTLIGHVLEGAITLDHEGRPTREYKAGETFNIDPDKIHEGVNKGTVPVRLLVGVVFPKDKPMTIPVQ